MPYRLLFPAIMVFSAIGIYSSNNVSFDVYLAALFRIDPVSCGGCSGCSPVPMLLGFVLGPMMEETPADLQVSNGDPSVFVTQPISLGFNIATVLILIVMVLPTVRKRRGDITG